MLWKRSHRNAPAEDGDEFLSALEAHRDEFFRFIYRNVWDTSVAEDVFSQSVLAAYENRHRYAPGTNFRAWMYRILTNKCYITNRETEIMEIPVGTVMTHLARGRRRLRMELNAYAAQRGVVRPFSRVRETSEPGATPNEEHGRSTII